MENIYEGIKIFCSDAMLLFRPRGRKIMSEAWWSVLGGGLAAAVITLGFNSW